MNLLHEEERLTQSQLNTDGRNFLEPIKLLSLIAGLNPHVRCVCQIFVCESDCVCA